MTMQQLEGEYRTAHHLVQAFIRDVENGPKTLFELSDLACQVDSGQFSPTDMLFALNHYTLNLRSYKSPIRAAAFLAWSHITPQDPAEKKVHLTRALEALKEDPDPYVQLASSLTVGLYSEYGLAFNDHIKAKAALREFKQHLLKAPSEILEIRDHLITQNAHRIPNLRHLIGKD